jgi:hypothetical protein
VTEPSHRASTSLSRPALNTPIFFLIAYSSLLHTYSSAQIVTQDKIAEMARETRSATGNSKPRVVPVVDTAPTIKRKAAPKKAAPKAETKGAKPTGVTKKKAAPKKDSGVAKKVRIPPPLVGIEPRARY